MSKRASNTTATARLMQDYQRLKKDPVPYVTAEPLPSNVLEWHYIVRGPEGSPYVGGIYHGKLVFPREFPFKPPSIFIMTPNGRFQCNKRLCLSISDFHPDTWNPAWSVSTILTGLLSFMLEMTPTLGSIETSTPTKRALAAQSAEFNLKNSTFVELFPSIVGEIKAELARRKAEVERSTSGFSTELRTVESSQRPVRMEMQPIEGVHGDLIGGGVPSLLIIVTFAVFFLIVRHILRSINEA